MSEKIKLEPSETLSPEGMAEFQRMASAAESLGRKFKPGDSIIITITAKLIVLQKSAFEQVQREGMITVHTNGIAGLNPAWKALRELTVIIRGHLNDLGLTPVARDFDAQKSEVNKPPLKF